MKVCTCLLLFGIFAYTNSTWIKTKVDHDSINSDTEYVSNLSGEENDEDEKILDNAHSFITKETKTTEKHDIEKHLFKAVSVETFTDFIQEVLNILQTYEDTAFEDFFHILDEEIRRYHYGDCIFSELTRNDDTRSALAVALQMIRGKSVSFMKANINEMVHMMTYKSYGDDVKELFDYINSLYINTEQKFNKVLNELKHYRKTKTIKEHYNLVQVIRDGVRDILFDHYTKLNSNTRRELKMRIEKFWNQFKNNPSSISEVNYSHETKEVSASVIDNIKVSKNVINDVKEPQPHFKINTQENLRNNGKESDDKDSYSREESIDKDSYNEKSQDQETEKDENSNEINKQNTDSNETSSGQSFDSSSNSIKQSLERHEEYKKQRYMTLYTEKMSYRARSTKEAEIIPISLNEMTKTATVPKRPTDTSAPKHSSKNESNRSKKVLRFYHDSHNIKQDISDSDTESILTVKPRARSKTKQDEKQRKHGKADKSKSTRKQDNVHVIGEYNAVIDVHLDNTDLLKSFGIIKPRDNKFDSTSYQSVIQTKSVATRPTLQFRGLGAGVENKPKNPFLTKLLSKNLRTQKLFSINRLTNTRNKYKILNLLPEEANVLRQTIIDKKLKLKLTRRNANNLGINRTVLNVPKNFNEYVIKRLDVLEKDLNTFRRKLYDNHTHKVELSNVTDKFNTNNNTGNNRKDMINNDVNLKNEKHDINEVDHNKENNAGHSLRINITNTDNTSLNSNETKKINTTVIIDNKNASQVTNSNVNENKQLNISKINNNETAVTVKVTCIKELTAFRTPATTVIMTKPTDDLPNLQNYIDHINDGLDLNM